MIDPNEFRKHLFGQDQSDRGCNNLLSTRIERKVTGFGRGDRFAPPGLYYGIWQNADVHSSWTFSTRPARCASESQNRIEIERDIAFEAIFRLEDLNLIQIGRRTQGRYATFANTKGER
jgi:hypothetical protein